VSKTTVSPASSRALLVAVLLLFAGVALTSQQASSTISLERLLDATRVEHRLPSLAMVTVRSDGQPQVYVSGERRVGRGELLGPTDLMHLGSLTKAITATVAGALTERRRLTLDTTIGEVFPELSTTQPAYRRVTLRQLLGHAGGIPPYRTREALQRLLALPGNGTEQRLAFVRRVLAEPSRFAPGSSHEYSNAGAAIAGAMVERIGGASYRQLVQELVFTPLGGRAAFGNPGLMSMSQPWGHIATAFGAVAEVAPDDPVYTTPLAIEAAGDVSLSPRDYGRFLQMHLRGLRGRDDVLKAATVQELHRDVAPTATPGFAMGWSLMPRDGVLSHEHVGSYGAFVAFATIQPSRDVAVAVFTNIGGGQELRNVLGRLALDAATRLSDGAAVR
jgi:CubicO group peptidase (beta-lactamase class C family)